MKSRISGYSLVELVIVLAVLALVGSISLVSGRAWIQAYELRESGVLLAAECNGARAVAIATNIPAILVIAEDRRSYGRSSQGNSPRTWTRLPKEIRFQSVPGQAVAFYPRGNAAPAGTFVLASPAGALRVVVAPMGRVRWEWIR